MVSADVGISTGTSEDDNNIDDDDDRIVSLEFHISPETLDSDSVFRNHWGCSA
ncbi:hypothetical protein TRAPUB_8113 [Trametes pubescens]|uniref:Uncharacterized protein n=1 Tax=Trametes pubescens TaxID=154538 RepID=A0A1M2W644_TRAPU|nr:hypothetical protein TRAPUB_8113 [Trametes pubescens]